MADRKSISAHLVDVKYDTGRLIMRHAIHSGPESVMDRIVTVEISAEDLIQHLLSKEVLGHVVQALGKHYLSQSG